MGVQGLDDLWSGDFEEWINQGVTGRGTEGSTERVPTERVPLPNASPNERDPKPLALELAMIYGNIVFGKYLELVYGDSNL